jgi:hypothetical protein
MSPFREVVVTLQVHLLPSRLENIQAGIEEQLSGYLMEYVGKLVRLVDVGCLDCVCVFVCDMCGVHTGMSLP